jgi:hypothetical protein
MGDEIDEIDFGFNTRNIIFDFTDLDNPELAFDYTGPTSATDHNGYVKGDKFYLANYQAGMRVVDISNIANGNMTETGYFDVFIYGNSAGYDGAWNVYPYFESGNIIISSLVYSDPNYVPGFYLVKSSSLGMGDNTISNFNIHPNPSSSNVKISAIETQIKTIDVYDLNGKLLISNQYNSVATTDLNVADLSSGIYLLKINKQVSKKLIKN